MSLKAIDSKESARAIVNHFGWFLRSLCFAWADGDELTRMKAACLFARYLAYNRYRRLAEVSLCFIETFASSQSESSLKKALVQASDDEFKAVKSIFQENHGDRGFPDSYSLLFKRWSPLVGSIGTIRH
jgi:Tfp pilus assembly protein PilF